MAQVEPGEHSRIASACVPLRVPLSDDPCASAFECWAYGFALADCESAACCGADLDVCFEDSAADLTLIPTEAEVKLIVPYPEAAIDACDEILSAQGIQIVSDYAMPELFVALLCPPRST